MAGGPGGRGLGGQANAWVGCAGTPRVAEWRARSCRVPGGSRLSVSTVPWVRFGTVKSQGQVQAIRSLGATPMEIFRRSRNQALLAGQLGGFEMNLLLYEHAVWPAVAPYVTANATLWPQMNVVFANPDRLAR